jgi:hypothetical protein
MTLESRRAITDQNPSSSNVYLTSEMNDHTGEWIQPSITDQILDYVQVKIIDNLYVQTSPIGEPKSHKSLSESELAKMAADPEIQAEIQRINAEFAGTELDGLTDDL